jgi:chorismate synthase
MGGSVWSIVLLLTNDFSKLVLISNLIAWPVAWFTMSRWLENFAYRIDLTPLIFIGSGLIALCIAWVTVAEAAKAWEGFLDGVRKAGSSTGAVIEVVASGVPAGLGEPVYDKLDADLAKAMMSINAVKSVEIGAGLEAAALSGEENADEMRLKGNLVVFTAIRAGGILGGSSTGQDVVVRFAVKPTSSILTPRRTVDRHGKETDIVTKGRHDPCVGIRAVPVGEAMMAIVLADHLLRQRALTGSVED